MQLYISSRPGGTGCCTNGCPTLEDKPGKVVAPAAEDVDCEVMSGMARLAGLDGAAVGADGGGGCCCCKMFVTDAG